MGYGDKWLNDWSTLWLYSLRQREQEEQTNLQWLSVKVVFIYWDLSKPNFSDWRKESSEPRNFLQGDAWKEAHLHVVACAWKKASTCLLSHGDTESVDFKSTQGFVLFFLFFSFLFLQRNFVYSHIQVGIPSDWCICFLLNILKRLNHIYTEYLNVHLADSE